MGMGGAQKIRISLPRPADVVGEPAGAGDEANIFLATDRLTNSELSQRYLLPDRRENHLPETCTIHAADQQWHCVAELPVSSACKLSNSRMSRASLNETALVPMFRTNSAIPDIVAPRIVGGLDRSKAMMSKRVGNWAWALSGEERIAAAIVGRSQSEKSPISAKLKRKYDAMLEKQRKLTKH
jgi:hypothetical protein